MAALDIHLEPGLITDGEKLASFKRVLELSMNLCVGQFMWRTEYGAGITTVQLEDSRCEAPSADPHQGYSWYNSRDR